MKKWIVLLIIALFTIISCSTTGGIGRTIGITSSSITIPDEIKDKVLVSLIGPARDKSASYANPGGLDVVITNNSSSIIKVLWSKSTFLSPDGISHTILLNGMKYSDAGNPPPDSLVPPKAFTKSQAFYAENVSLGGMVFIKPIPTSSTTLLICLSIDGKEYFVSVNAGFQ